MKKIKKDSDDIIFKPFPKQVDVLRSKKRIIATFGGKRCISPLSKVLSTSGVKSFGDISSSDKILSFHEKANLFLFQQSTDAFPKMKSSGYRVIHERGEFLASSQHLVFCSDFKYRSCEEIFKIFNHNEEEITFICLDQSIEEFYKKDYLLYNEDVFLPSKSSILSIEPVSTQWWWDVTIEGTNNYFSEGAVHHNSGKSEVCCIKAIMLQEEKPNRDLKTLDPYQGLIVAPTFRMLSQVTMRKFMQFAKPFIKSFNKSNMEIVWHDGSLVVGASADRPSRIEGLKLNWAYIDEAAQCDEKIFLELKARTTDSKGYILSSTSLGVQYINPKATWVYKHFIESPNEHTDTFTWKTLDNPYIDPSEIESLKNNLDPQTFRAMFEIDWDTVPKNSVYYDFCEDNILTHYSYNSSLPTYVAMDFGIAHPTSIIFAQYDEVSDTIYVFDEILASRKPLDYFLKQILARPYRVKAYCCDIAGNQDQLQTGRSNIDFFKQHNIHFKTRSSAILYGVSIVRSYILDSKGRRRLYVSDSCKHTIDGLKRYRFHEKNGAILNENPVKEDDDMVDALRYLFVNFFDKNIQETKFTVKRIR